MTQERKSKAARIRKHLQEDLLSVSEIARIMKVKPEYVRAVRIRAQGPGNYYDQWCQKYRANGDHEKARKAARAASARARKAGLSPLAVCRAYSATHTKVVMQTGKQAVRSQVLETN